MGEKLLWSVMACLALCLLTPQPSDTQDISLLGVGVRGGLSGSSPIGEQTKQHFQQYDVMATFAFPSAHYSVRREKALCVSQVQVLSGESSGHPSSYQDDQKGN
jgi:hypothetical protein